MTVPGATYELHTSAYDDGTRTATYSLQPSQLATHQCLDEILVSVNENLALAQKEDLMLMVLKVISADNQKDAGEMKLLAALIEGLKIPDKIMNKVYEQYFEDK